MNFRILVSESKTAVEAPVAKKIPYTITNPLGRTRVDDYHWIRDENWKKVCADGPEHFANPDILEYVKAENEFTKQSMADTEELQQELYDEMISRLKEDDSSVPVKDGLYYYYRRTEKGKDYPFLCRKKAATREELADAPEEIHMDVNKDAEPFEQYSLGASRVSPNHQKLAYAFNLSGSLNYTIKVRDLETGQDCNWAIDDTNGSLRWANNNRHLFYVTRHPENGRGYEVRLLDTESGANFLIFTKPEKFGSMFMSLSKTVTKQWVVINIADHASNELRLVNASCPENYREGGNLIPELITPLVENVKYDIDHFEDLLYIHTNMDDATNFKVMVTTLDALRSEHWKEFISPQEGIYIDSTSVYQTPAKIGYFVRQVTYTDRALAGIIVHNLATGEEYTIDMPEEAYDLSFRGSKEFITQTVRFHYESPIQPSQVIELDLETQERSILKTREVPNYDSTLYQTRRCFAKAYDGEMIPLTIMYRKGTPLDSTAPAFVYGYGSYGWGMTAYFSANRISLLDRGFVFAIAHVRGGDDKGYGWYLDGKLHKKKNTFLDFISCCEFLIEEGYTSKGNIVANGGSAGGMLMGAIANMRPDLFKAVIADVAFVDVMNTMEDTNLPLTESEWNEWGNPLEDAEAYDYMLSYSPYDNIVAQDYPHMFFNSGISDEQVTYWEPTKMVARLRAMKTDDNLLLLKMKMTAGHGGASKRYESYKELAFDYAFCLKAVCSGS